MSEIVDTKHIELRQTRRGNDKAYIVGSRLAVEDVFVHHAILGKTADQIVEAFEHLSLAQVHAALSYAFDHIDEIREQMKASEAFVEGARSRSGPGPLDDKLGDMGANGDPISS